ncbi:hypothetical protein HNO51_12480 [Billgrantia sulfidoxydans]|uniref:Terminase n=1 Tax=Billgrantia sulfidoxydans TaxID=2733484 RepID=A0ABX7W6P8_9GAMM|nr:hypothetical protein [Halomonas sulfidoxydans]QTP55425.1 hypothetical protein HNO51_12480 [Halomonas sulfidoxydans]
MSVTIRDAMIDPALFGGQFGDESFLGWRALLAGFYGLPLQDDELDAWQQITRRSAPTSAAEELWLVVGRRGGKSQAAALLAVFEACFRDYRDKLSPGERATVMVLAADRKQARSAFRYITGLIESNPMLAALVERQDAESIDLTNRCTIEVHTASFRAVRGYSTPLVIADEIAFWRSEDSANPDKEIINAIRPAMATLGGRLVALSSPYARRGELWETYRRDFGKESEILVAQAPSRVMNPTLPARVVERALERDEASAKAEYLAEFRSDVEAFLTREVVEACTELGRIELPPITGTRYTAFTDPAGGSGKDAFTLAIGHLEGSVAVVDAIRSRKPPFSPEAVVAEFSDLLKQYRISSVTGDRYAGEFPRELYRNQGITYEIADRPRSDLYRDMLPLMNSGRVSLPENAQLLKELVSLERRTARSGKDTIDHGPGGHDDLANSVAGVVTTLGLKRQLRPFKDWL